MFTSQTLILGCWKQKISLKLSDFIPESRVIPGTPNNGTHLWYASHTIPPFLWEWYGKSHWLKGLPKLCFTPGPWRLPCQKGPGGLVRWHLVGPRPDLDIQSWHVDARRDLSHNIHLATPQGGLQKPVISVGLYSSTYFGVSHNPRKTHLILGHL